VPRCRFIRSCCPLPVPDSPRRPPADRQHLGGIVGDDVTPAPVPGAERRPRMGLALVTVAIVGRRIRR
jgi:hypothetical protein